MRTKPWQCCKKRIYPPRGVVVAECVAEFEALITPEV